MGEINSMSIGIHFHGFLMPPRVRACVKMKFLPYIFIFSYFFLANTLTRRTQNIFYTNNYATQRNESFIIQWPTFHPIKYSGVYRSIKHATIFPCRIFFPCSFRFVVIFIWFEFLPFIFAKEMKKINHAVWKCSNRLFFFHLCATIGIYLTWFRSVLFIILTSVSRRYANLSVVPSSGAISFRYASLTVVVHTLIETDTSSKREKLCHCFPEDINYAIIKSLYNWHHQMGDQPRNSVVRRIYNTREFFFILLCMSYWQIIINSDIKHVDSGSRGKLSGYSNKLRYIVFWGSMHTKHTRVLFDQIPIATLLRINGRYHAPIDYRWVWRWKKQFQELCLRLS